MQKIILVLALPIVLMSSAHASEWNDMIKAATAAASPQTRKAINDILHGHGTVPRLQTPQSNQVIPETQLTDVLMQRTGLTQAQAQGGVGVLLQMAQSKLKPAEFAQLEQAIPNVQNFLTSVTPEMLSSLAQLASGSGGTINNLITAVSLFKQLGMTPEQIQQFVPLVLDYVNTKQGASVAKLFGSAILGH
jgi:Protein of unknown function VcgC/VcgE (DUF2780)